MATCEVCGNEYDLSFEVMLSRSPGRTGFHAALTGFRMNAADAILLGLADALVSASQHEQLIEQISEVGADAAIGLLSTAPGPSHIGAARHWIDRCYDAESVEQILRNLAGTANVEAQQAMAAIESAAPTAVKVTLRAMRSAGSLPLLAALNQEFRMISAALRSADLAEGIRAQVIDKDRNPRWSPSSVEDVSSELVDRYFADVPNLPFPEAVAAQGQPSSLIRGGS